MAASIGEWAAAPGRWFMDLAEQALHGLTIRFARVLVGHDDGICGH
jgi:hypothetical protein